MVRFGSDHLDLSSFSCKVMILLSFLNDLGIASHNHTNSYNNDFILPHWTELVARPNEQMTTRVFFEMILSLPELKTFISENLISFIFSLKICHIILFQTTATCSESFTIMMVIFWRWRWLSLFFFTAKMIAVYTIIRGKGKFVSIYYNCVKIWFLSLSLSGFSIITTRSSMCNTVYS